MIRNILFFLFIFFNVSPSSAFTCYLQNIETDYNRSTIVFYGQLNEEVDSSKFYDMFGRRIKLLNFNVAKVFKVVDSSYVNNRKKVLNDYIISIAIEKSEYRSNFQVGKYYLVYAYFDRNIGVLTTDGCLRNREIINENFVAQWELENSDNGKNELNELYKLSSKDSSVNIRNIEKMSQYNNRKLIEQINSLEAKSRKYLNALLLACAISIIAIGVLILKRTRKPG